MEGSLEMQRNFVAMSRRAAHSADHATRHLACCAAPRPSRRRQADVLSDIVEESDRLIRLVNDLLMLARTRRRVSLTLQSVDVSPLLEDLPPVEQLDPERQIDLAIDPDLRVVATGTRSSRWR